MGRRRECLKRISNIPITWSLAYICTHSHPEGFLGSASPTSASGCPRAVPFTVPGGTPASPPTMEGGQLGEGTLGGASSVAFFWVGLAQCQVASQAIPHLKHPSVQDSLMKGHGVQALRVLSLLFRGGDRKSTRLNSSHTLASRMPSSA